MVLARWAYFAGTLLLAGVGSVCVVTSRDRLSATFDESLHLATGLEWLQYGTYNWWTETPPLARVAIALPLYVSGARLPPRDQWDPHHHPLGTACYIGLDILHAGGGYETNLRRARWGTFPFFLLTLAATWLLAQGHRRPVDGLIAVGFVATLPPILAHSQLATTDMAFTGTFLLAVATLRRWLGRPTIARALTVGAATGLVVLAKLTTFVLLIPGLLALVIWRRCVDTHAFTLGTFVRHAGIALISMGLVTWAGYRFAVGRVDSLNPREYSSLFAPPAERGLLARAVLERPWPAHELLHGLLAAARHYQRGHRAYLFGRTSDHGFWSFYPTAVIVKTPLPTLLAWALGALLLAARKCRRERGAVWSVALVGLLMLALLPFSRVNLGLRHVLPALPLLTVAMASSVGCAITYGGRARARLAAGCVGALIAWQTVVAFAVRPNHLAYFNELVRDPAAVLLTSDLDWGQALLQLREEARRRQIPKLKIAYHGMNRLCDLGLPPLEDLRPGEVATGWIAVSENFYRERSWLGWSDDPCVPTARTRPEVPPHPLEWLRGYEPVTIVGGSIRLYYVP